MLQVDDGVMTLKYFKHAEEKHNAFWDASVRKVYS